MDIEELIKSALELLDKEMNNEHHILQSKHAWAKLVEEPIKWEKIRPFIAQTLEKGTESTYKKVWKRELEIKDNILVTVTFDKLIDDKVTMRWEISDAWVNRTIKDIFLMIKKKILSTKLCLIN